jgi:quercetin dioxygenase-like cupin family protein
MTSSTLSPVATTLPPGEGESLWVFGALATVKASSETTGAAVAVIEHLAPMGAGSPLHVHHSDDEWFYVIEGSMTFWVGGEVFEAEAGAFVYGPRDIPHTFLVTSEEARFLLVTEPAGFEKFLRTMGRPAEKLTIPPPAAPPEDLTPLIAAAAEHGIEILGPPGIPA